MCDIPSRTSMSHSVPSLVKWFRGRSKRSKTDSAHPPRTPNNGGRSGRLLPPIPRDLNRSPFHRSTTNSPAHIYEEIPLNLDPSELNEYAHNVDIQNLDFSLAKEYGCYLVVPLKDRFDRDPRFQSSLTSRSGSDRRRHPIFGLNSNVPSPAPSPEASAHVCDDDYLESVCSSLNLETSGGGKTQCQNCGGSLHRPKSRSNGTSTRYHSIATLDLLKFSDSDELRCDHAESRDTITQTCDESPDWSHDWGRTWPSRVPPPHWQKCRNNFDDLGSPIGDRNVYEDLPISPATPNASWESENNSSKGKCSPRKQSKNVARDSNSPMHFSQDGDYAYHLSKAQHNLSLKEEVIRFIKLSESSEGEYSESGETYVPTDNYDSLTNVTSLSDRSMGSSVTLLPDLEDQSLNTSYMEIGEADDSMYHFHHQSQPGVGQNSSVYSDPVPVESDDMFEYYEVQDVPKLRDSHQNLSKSHRRYMKSGQSCSGDQSVYEETDKLSCRVSNIVPAYKVYRPLYSVMYSSGSEASLYSGRPRSTGPGMEPNSLLGDLMRHNNDRQILLLN